MRIDRDHNHRRGQRDPEKHSIPLPECAFPSTSLAGSYFPPEAAEPDHGGNPNYMRRCSFRSPLHISSQFGIKQIEIRDVQADSITPAFLMQG